MKEPGLKLGSFAARESGRRDGTIFALFIDPAQRTAAMAGRSCSLPSMRFAHAGEYLIWPYAVNGSCPDERERLMPRAHGLARAAVAIGCGRGNGAQGRD